MKLKNKQINKTPNPPSITGKDLFLEICGLHNLKESIGKNSKDRDSVSFGFYFLNVTIVTFKV